MPNPPPQATPPHRFRQMILANSRYWLDRAEREELAVMAETPQLLKALDYVLALDDEAGTVGYELLGHLSPLMIRQGQFRAWEGLLRRGIARSAAAGHSAEIELRLHLGNIYRLQGRLAEAQRCLEAGLALSEQQGGATHQATLLNYLGLVARLSGHHEAALAYSRRVVDDPERTPIERAEALNVLGLVAFDRRKWEKSLHYIDQALALYRALNDPYNTARLLTNRGLVLRKSHRFDESAESFQAAIQQFKAAGDHTEIFKPIMNLGIVFWERKEYQAAILKYKEALRLFKQHDYLIDQAHVYNNLGMAYMGLQDWSTAETYFRASADIWQNVGDKEYYVANAFDNLGMMFTEAGEISQAKEAFQQALDVLAASKNGPAETDLRVKVEKRLTQLD